MFIRNILRRVVQAKRKRHLNECGKDVDIQRNCNFVGNIHIGNHVLVGTGANFVSLRAALHIHDYVVFGPDVSIYTGDHAINIVGVHISEVTNQMKNESGYLYDKDVCIEAGCWVGTRSIILKGVTIGRGSVIGAGSIVTKNVPPYSIYTGAGSNAVIRKRFSPEQIECHESKLIEAGKPIY